MMRVLFTFLFTLLCFSSPAEVVVIGNSSEWSEEGINKQDLKRLYKGESFSFTVTDNKSLRDKFYKKFVSQSYEENLKKWGILVFTGRASRPKVFNNDKEVVVYVRENPKAIGFIDDSNIDKGVIVISR